MDRMTNKLLFEESSNDDKMDYHQNFLEAKNSNLPIDIS